MLIPRKVFEAASIAKKDSNHMLHYVRLERAPDGSPHVIATDGKSLIDVTWTEPPAEEWPERPGLPKPTTVPGFTTNLPSKAFKDLGKLASKSRIRPILEHVALTEPVNGCAEFGGTDLDQDSVQSLETRDSGVLTAWRGVVPDYSDRTAVTVHVDPTRLRNLLDTLIKTGAVEDSEKGITIHVPRKANRALRLEATSPDGTIRAVGVLMPIA